MRLEWSSIPPKRGSGGAGEVTDERRVLIISRAVTKWKSMGLSREQIAFGVAMMRVESGFNPEAKGPSTTEMGLGQFNNKTWQDAVNEYNRHYRSGDEPRID